MLVTLWTSQRRRISADFAATVKWCAPVSGEFGSASFVIPHTSPAYKNRYFAEDGGQLVDLYKAGVGRWRGVTIDVEEDENGAAVHAIAFEAVTSVRFVSTNRVFEYCSAAIIVREAVREAVSGLARSFIGEGSFCEDGVFIPRYEFTGQSLAQVLADMMDLTGSEWQMSEDGAISWTPRLGVLQQRHLCQDGDVVSARRRASVGERAAQVTARGVGNAHTEDANEVLGTTWWPQEKQVDVQTSSLGVLVETARIAIDAARWPAVQYEMTLRAHVPEEAAA